MLVTAMPQRSHLRRPVRHGPCGAGGLPVKPGRPAPVTRGTGRGPAIRPGPRGSSAPIVVARLGIGEVHSDAEVGDVTGTLSSRRKLRFSPVFPVLKLCPMV